MNVIVNGKKLVLFEGAKAKDALTLFKKNNPVSKDYEILDAFGNKVDESGALTEGARLFVRKKK